VESPIPEVQIARGVIAKICKYVSEFLRDNGEDNEAGGMLVGRFEPGDGGRTSRITVVGFIPAGPAAEYGPSSILFDASYQRAVLRVLQLQDPMLRAVGCIHRHPGAFDECSSGDLEADREALRGSSAEFLLFGVITLDNWREDSTSLRWGNMKLDFFLLGEATGLNYRKVRVQIVAGEVLPDIPEALVSLATARGASLTYDISTLKRVDGVAGLRLVELAGGGRSCAAICLRDDRHRAEISILAHPSGGLQCVVQRDGSDLRLLQGPWSDQNVGGLVWFSQILLSARRLLSDSTGASISGSRRHALWWERNTRRLDLEKRAMFEVHGHKVTLHQEGQRLFWKATLHESGRSLEVRVIYPDEYPVVPPVVESTKDLPNTPHSPGQTRIFCWVPHSGRSDWNPTRGTAVVALAAAARWYAALLVHQSVGRWPSEADHPPVLSR